MPTIDEQLQKKKPFKKKAFRSYLSLDETLDSLNSILPEKEKAHVPEVSQNDVSQSLPTENLKHDKHDERDQFPLSTHEMFHNGDTQPALLTLTETNSQASYREHTKDLQETHKELTSNPQLTYKEPTRNSQDASTETSPNQQETYKELYEEPTRTPTKNLQETHKKPTRLHFNLLTGLRKETVRFIYENCKAARSDITDPFTFESVGIVCRTTARSAGETIKQLAKEGYLNKVDNKKGGKGAWHIYQLPEDIYQSILMLETSGKLTRNLQETHKEPYAQPTSEPTKSLPSSSTVLEDLKLTTQTQIEPDKKKLPPEWEEIDFSYLESIGFKKHHLWQIYEAGKSSPEMVQESIYELAHDLKSGSQLGIKNPLALIMKNLKVKGIPYSAVTPGYENDEIRYQRKRIEELKRRQKLLAELKEEEEHLKSQIANDADEVNFQSWLKSKTEQEVKAITGSFVDPALPGGRAILKQAYQKEMASDPNSALTREQVRAIMSAQLGDL